MKLLFFVVFVGVALSQPFNYETLVPCPMTSTSKCFKVGFSYQGSGGLAPEGTYMRNGYVLWAERVNANPPRLKDNTTFGIELIGADDGTNSGNTAAIYTELLTMVDYLLGPFGSSFSNAAATVVDPSGNFIILSNAASDYVYQKGFQNIYGVVTVASKYCPPAISLYTANGAQTFYLAQASNNGFALEVGQGCFDAIAASPLEGVELTGSQAFETPINQSFAIDIVQAAEASEADVFLNIGRYGDMEEFVLGGATQAYDPKGWFMNSAPGNPDFIEDFPSQSQFLVGPSQWASQLVGFEDSFWGTSQDYTEIYEKRFEGDEGFEEVSYIAASASAAGTVLHVAILTADLFNTQVVEQVRFTDIELFYGPIQFGANGTNIKKEIVLTQVVKGEIEVVFPPQHETRDLVFPATFNSASPLFASFPLLSLAAFLFLKYF